MPTSPVHLVIRSGGQTGVDRAALDVALRVGVPVTGWCPRGRRAEDGPIPARYPLRETPSADYAERTRWNVRDADATLVLTHGPLVGGTVTTVEAARAFRKPFHVVDLADRPEVEPVAAWVRAVGAGDLNVAGPRASTYSGAYADVVDVMTELLNALGASGR